MDFGTLGCRRGASVRHGWLLWLSSIFLLLHLAAPAAAAMEWGVNVHGGGSNPETMARKLAERHLTWVRMDLWGSDPAYLAKFKRAVSCFHSQGIKVQAVLFTDFSPGARRNQDLGADLSEVEQTAYQQTLSQVNATKDLIRDYELGNEITLGTPHILADGATGQKATDFDTPAGHLQAAVLRGMSHAIRDARADSGLPLRILLGTVNRHWGFLAFMQQQGVLFDVVGYHIYPWEKHPPLDQDPWFGPRGTVGAVGPVQQAHHHQRIQRRGDLLGNCRQSGSGLPQPQRRPGHGNELTLTG